MPKLFYIDHGQGSKNILIETTKETKGMSTTHKWTKTQGIKVKDMIRLEW